MDFKKLNFKQPKYIIPLISMPFTMFLAYQIGSLIGGNEEEEIKPQTELSLSLGDSKDSILAKNEAYEELFTNKDSRTMLDGLSEEQDSLNYYSDNLNDRQRRYIDSLEAVRKLNREAKGVSGHQSYYDANALNSGRNNDRDYQRSAEIIRMLNEGSNGRQEQTNSSSSREKDEDDPVKTLRKQMLFMDSLEKAKDPNFIAQQRAEENLKRNKEKMDAFLNSTLKVSKQGLNPAFNSITKQKTDNFVKAVIDENSKGYLGSRIRFRLLEDIFVGKHRIPQGTFIYGHISGFSMQRVSLSIVSIMNNGEILPINLSVYDIDGMKGLYVPESLFREMLKELGQNSVQGTSLSNEGQVFFTSMLSRAFQSTSQTIANLIRKNKAKLKYNSYIYLINEKELTKNENN